jgi:hypothetical protein
MILDFRGYFQNLKKITNFRYHCNEKLNKLTGPIRFLLARDNRTSANVADCYNFFDF